MRRLNDGKDLFNDAKLKRFAIPIKLLYRALKPKARDYVIALKKKGHGGR